MLAVALGKITGVAMIAGVSLMSPAALAQPDRNGPEAVTVSQLKEIYLDCDRRAVGGSLNSSEIAGCSVIYEELKRRAFGGDFEKLRAWSQAQAPVKSAAR